MILFALKAKSTPAPGAWYVTGLLGWTDDPAMAVTFATRGQAGRWLARYYHLLYAVDVVPLDLPATIPDTRREQPPATAAGLVHGLADFRRALAANRQTRGGPC